MFKLKNILSIRIQKGLIVGFIIGFLASWLIGFALFVTFQNRNVESSVNEKSESEGKQVQQKTKKDKDQEPCTPSNQFGSETKNIDFSNETNELAVIWGCHIFVFDFQKKHLNPSLSEYGRIFNYIKFSPNGSKLIAYDQKNKEILVISNNNSKVIIKDKIKVKDLGYREQLDWSPDGNELIFLDEFNLFKYNLNSRTRDLLTTIEFNKNNIIEPRIKWAKPESLLIIRENDPTSDNVYTTATINQFILNDKLESVIARISINNNYYQRNILDISNNNKLIYYSSNEGQPNGNKSLQKLIIKDLNNKDIEVKIPESLNEIVGIKWRGNDEILVQWAKHLEAGGTSIFGLSDYTTKEIYQQAMGDTDTRVPIGVNSIFINQNHVIYPIKYLGIAIFESKIGTDEYKLISTLSDIY